MKRHLLRILLCLVLGAVTTVGVAWGCAIWSPIALESQTPTDTEWQAPVAEGWPRTARHWRRTGLGLDESTAIGDAPIHATPSVVWCTEQWLLRAGWPERSMYVERQRARVMSGAYWPLYHSQPGTWRCGLQIPSWVPRRPEQAWRLLPTRPAWPGFLIDTLFYGAIWFALLSGFSATRRIVRHTRGRCLACGYDLQGTDHEACPECGAPPR